MTSSRSEAAGERLVEDLLVDPAEVMAIVDGASSAPLEPDAARRAVELLGSALWDVFSANHTVTDELGTPCDLGSFRATAGAIADAMSRRYASLEVTWNYLDFYLGTMSATKDVRVGRIYEWIFVRVPRRVWPVARRLAAHVARRRPRYESPAVARSSDGAHHTASTRHENNSTDRHP